MLARSDGKYDRKILVYQDVIMCQMPHTRDGFVSLK